MMHPRPTRSFLPALSGLFLAIALFGQTGEAQARPVSGEKSGVARPTQKPAGPRLPIAVVDVGKASTHTKAMRNGLEELRTMHGAYQKSLEALGKQLETLDLEISLMKIASPEKVEKQIEMSALLRRREAAKKLYDGALAERRTRMDALVYREIEAALAELATRNGLLLVLRKRGNPTLDELVKTGSSPEEAVKRQLSADRLRNVLYSAPAIDLTEDLIKYLKG